jgi:hypothetical protein
MRDFFLDLRRFVALIFESASGICAFCVVSTAVLLVLIVFTVEEAESVGGVCFCVFLGLGTLVASVATKVLVSRRYQFRRILHKWTGLSIFAPRTAQRSSDVLSENYLEELNHQTLIAIVIILIVSIGAVAMRDTGTLIISIVIVGLLLAQTALTEFRVVRGYFGANFLEARELIAFIVSKKDGGDQSPGTKVSRPYQITPDTDVDTKGLAGAKT